MRKILLGLTGSVATVLYEKLIKELKTLGDVDVILTKQSKHFLDPNTGPHGFYTFCRNNNVKIFTDECEWIFPEKTIDTFNPYTTTDIWGKDDPVLHIELRNNYSALVIAPCSMNTLAKISNGICDNLLTTVARAWDRNRPFLIAPAANTEMWDHPITNQQLGQFLKFSNDNYVFMPQKKMLACGTEGMGAMGEIKGIVEMLSKSLRWFFPIWNKYCLGIPVGTHPGAFLAKRKNSTHTGVDLYCDEGTSVNAVENGTVVAIEPFTGPKDKSPWWLDTDCILVEGATGVICYGEIEPNKDINVGDKIKVGCYLGRVLRVIPPDRPQHPELMGWKPNMLHMELYPHGYHKPSDGFNIPLQDPTQYLKEAYNAPTNIFI